MERVDSGGQPLCFGQRELGDGSTYTFEADITGGVCVGGGDLLCLHKNISRQSGHISVVRGDQDETVYRGLFLAI